MILIDADQVIDLTGSRRGASPADDVAAHATEELHALGTNQCQVDSTPLVLPFGISPITLLEQVGVQAAAKTAVRGNDDVTDALGSRSTGNGCLYSRVGELPGDR